MLVGYNDGLGCVWEEACLGETCMNQKALNFLYLLLSLFYTSPFFIFLRLQDFYN